MTKKRALQLIRKAYGSLDVSKIYTGAADRRVGSLHAEFPVEHGMRTLCAECGWLDTSENVDPVYHPEHYL